MLFKRFNDCYAVMERDKSIAMVLATLMFSLYLLIPEIILVYFGIKGMENISNVKDFTIVKVDFCLIFVYGMLYICFIMFQRKQIGEIVEKIAGKIYFKLFTKNGGAISKQDFRRIRKEDIQLYQAISEQKCIGACYAVCFELCRLLKKGTIEIIAIDNEDSDYPERYTAHVIYNRNEWSFDTNTILQYQTEEFYQASKAKHYRTFDYKELAKYSNFEVFMASIENGLFKWAEQNDCWTYNKFDYEI